MTEKPAPQADPFRRLLSRLLNVPKAEIDKIEAERPKKASAKAKKPAA